MASKTEKKENFTEQHDLSPLQLRILELLRENGSMTQDQICEEFGFKKRKVIQVDKYLLRERGLHISYAYERYDKSTTIYDNIIKLQKRNLVEIFSKSNGKRGRPKIFYKLTEGKYYIIEKN